VLVLIVAGALRLGALALVEGTPPAGDESGYLRRAQALASGVPEATLAERPPAYSAWGALWISATRAGPGALRAAGVVTGLAVVLLTAWLGRAHAGPLAGVTAAAWVALYPEQVLYDVSLWSESLYGALLLGAVALAVAARGTSGRAALLRGAGAGFLFGLSALTREVGLLALMAAAAWLAVSGGRSLRPASLAMMVVAIATVSPWSVAQSVRAGEMVLISRTTGQNLFLGNWRLEDPEAEAGPLAGPRKRARYESLGDTQGDREIEARRLAIAAIRDRMPAWPFEKMLSEIPDLVAPRSVPSARLAASPDSAGWAQRWAYRLPGAWGGAGSRGILAAVTVAAWVALGLAGTAGLALGAGRLGALFVALVAAHLVPVVVAFGITRFRLPLGPLLAVAGAALALSPRSAWDAASVPRRAAAALAVALFLVALWSRWDTLRSPGFG
jgi:hypothetical protein